MLGFALAKSAYFYRHSSDVIDILHDRQFAAAGIDADLLLVGESALLVGVKPQRVQNATGLSTYNLSTSVYQFIAASDLLIDNYLAKNRAPRLVVLYIAPWTRVNPPFPYQMEWGVGTKAIVRHGRPPDVAQFFVQHPELFLQFPREVWGDFVFQFDRSGSAYENVVNSLKEERGWLAIDGPVLRNPKRVLGDGCERIRFPIAPDKAYIDSFRRKLAARGIPAAVYIAPTPDCDPSDRTAEIAYSGIADNRPYQLAHRYFIDDPYLTHLVPEGAEENTARVIEFVKAFGKLSGVAQMEPNAEP